MVLATIIAVLTIRQLLLMNKKTKLEIEKLKLELRRLRRGG